MFDSRFCLKGLAASERDFKHSPVLKVVCIVCNGGGGGVGGIDKQT